MASIKKSLTMRTIKVGVILLAGIILSACSSNTEDLQAWVNKIKAIPAGRIDPMPDIKEYKSHDYSSAHLKSPFSELEPQLEEVLQKLHAGCDESIQPDTSRRKEDLERYSLDSMEMVGTVKNKDKLWGLIRMTAGPAEGNVFHVNQGNYLGINHGQIVGITEDQIEITTLVPDNKGCWEKRVVYMALAQ